MEYVLPYVYVILAVVYGAAAGYVGYRYGRQIEAKAQLLAKYAATVKKEL